MVEDVWEKHLLSDEHFRRMTAFMASKLGENTMLVFRSVCGSELHGYSFFGDMFGFSESCSAYTVKPFVQKDPNKKITWQWNSKNKVHDFVLSIIGLEDLVERRSNEVVGEHAPDFFCRLCATVIPRRAMLLEAHVRSVQHVLCYLHKYHPLTILKIDGLPKEGGREIRRAIAQRLKDVRPKSEYCIPVYDPIGEQERKGIVAMQKAKEEERQRQMAEARKKAQEERKRKDEERRKLREQEIERERNRKIERERKEKEARDRAKRIEDERQRLRQVALENAQKVEDEKRAQVTEEKGRRQSQQAQLRSILDREKARLKVLQDRDKAQRLVQEKLDLEQKMKELQEKAALQKPVVVVPDPQLIIPAKLVNKPSQMPPITMISVPPPNMSVIPSTFNQYGVPPPVNSFTMSSPNVQYSEPPPELIRNTLELVGPKPVFSSFVPVAESMPIYPTRDAENSSDYDCSRSRSSSSSQTRSLSPSYHVYRPSLHGREVDPYITNPKIMHTRAQLVDFIWRQGAERIPPNELPLKFNKKASGMEGVLGLDCLYEACLCLFSTVVCVDSPELDTFYCSMCGIWTTPSGMFIHLETKEHKLAYLFRNYKMYHQTVISETNNVVRTSMLSQFAIQIWRMEQPPSQVNNRLRSILDRATICRLWPEHVTVLDQSWRFEGNSVGRVDVPAPVSKEATQFNNPQKIVVKKSKSKDSDVEITDTDLPIVKKKKIDKKKTESFKQRKRSRSRDKRVDVMDINRRRKQMDLLSERKRRRSSSRDKHSRSRNWKHSHGRESRRRSRSRDSLRHNRSRSRENTVKDSNMSWEENAAAFLAKLGDFKAAAKVLDHKKNNHNNEKSQVTSPLDKQLGGGTPGINVDHQNSDLFAEKIKQIRNLAIPIQQKEIVQSMCAFDDISDICSGTQRQDSSYSRQPSCIQQSSQQQHFADEKVEMRKLLGVLITMQQEAERTGGLDAAIVDRLYREVGLQKKEGVANDQLLAQLCAQIAGQESPANKPAIDLESFGISKISNTEPTSQFHNQTPVSTNQYIPSTSHQLTSAILTKQRQVMNSSTNGSIFSLLSDVRSSLANIKSNRPPSPIVKPPPFVITKREDVFPESESFSFVYPDPDQEKERQEKVAFQSDSGSWKSPRNQFSFKNPHKNSFVFPQLIQASPGRNARSEYEPTYPAKPIRKLVQRGKLIVQEESNTSINNNQLTKKQKVALKKKELLEEAERLRKQAEEEGLDDGDDDWDNLETEMVQILDQPMVPKIGVPSTWTQPVPQKQKENPQTAKPEKIKENTPVLIASGQKMPLARTILPTRKLTSTLANNQQSPQLQEQWKNPTQQSSSSLDQKSALKRRLIGVPVSWPDSNTQAKELSVSTTQQKLSPLATVSSDYSQYYFSASQQPVYPTHPAYVTQSFFPQQPPPGFSQQQYYGQDAIEIMNINRCLDRLRSTRMNKFNCRREIEVDSIVRETAETVRVVSQVEDRVLSIFFQVKTEMGVLELNDVDWMLDIFEEMNTSLLREQYEDTIQLEEDRLKCEVSEYLNPSVFCPACAKFPMTVTDTAAECQGCPFRFNFKVGCSSPSPSQLNNLLTTAFGEHEIEDPWWPQTDTYHHESDRQELPKDSSSD
uniref:C2H2-type domain-containing protein n=1 Tax=Heterorhabditis bacteriophora TaxID=37862 RepID=A0A1I7XCN3_HETBA